MTKLTPEEIYTLYQSATAISPCYYSDVAMKVGAQVVAYANNGQNDQKVILGYEDKNGGQIIYAIYTIDGTGGRTEIIG